jgi:tetratricopeptide (TPR) repeat protein
MTLHRKILSALAIAAAALSICSARGTKSDWDSEALQRKADYVFMRACGANALDSLDTSSRLLARAALLSPNDVNIAGEQALLTLSQNTDSAALEQAYSQLKDLFESNPADYHTGAMVAQIAAYNWDFDEEVHVWRTLDSIFPSKTDPAINLANAYIKRYISTTDSANFVKGIDIFNRIERGTGKDIGLTSQKVRAYMLINDTTAIVNELNELIVSKPLDSSGYTYVGSIYNRLQRNDEALKYLTLACEIDSTNGNAYAELADFYHEIGDSVSYDREVFRALQSQNLEFYSKYQIMRSYVSELYTDTAQWPRIEKLFGALLEENSGEEMVYSLYGAFESSRERYPQALEQFSYAMALDPTDETTRASVVQTALAADSIDTMIDVALKGTKLFPTNFYFPIMAASGYQQKGEYMAAINTLKSVDISNVKNGKAVSNLLCTLADNYYRVDSLDTAFDTYEKAIRYDSENYMAYNNAGYFMAESGRDIEKAIRYTRYAVLSEPQNATYLDSYAWALFKNKEYEKARENIDLALKFSQTSDSVWVDDNNDADADSNVVEYVVNNPDDTEGASAEILSHAGDIYFMCGEPDKALAYWKQALALDPKNELLGRKVKNKTYFYK